MDRETGGKLLVCVVAMLCVTTVGATNASAGQIDGQGEPLTASEITITIELQPNGSAVWSIAYHYQLHTTSRQRAFERLHGRIDAKRSEYVSSIRRDIDPTVTLAANRTNRSMSLSRVSVRTHRQSIPRDVGTVVHQFTWHDFAVVDGTTIRAGDAIRGFYLGPRSVLTIRWPSGYSLARAEPSADSASTDEASWTNGGFDTDEPQVVLERDTGPPTMSYLSAIGLILVVASAGTVAYIRRNGDEIDSQSERSVGDQSTESSGELTVDGPDADGDEPPEPLSDSERVMWVLEAHDGRVKQQTIAEECEWGDSKTSKVIQDMDEADKIARFRLGRENVVTLPEARYDDD